MFDGKGGYGWGGKRSAAPMAANASPAETLTQRVCTEEYDVIHYRFTVVMPLRHLPLLEENLMQGGNHTVLGISITEMGSESRSNVKGSGSFNDLYYYGTDPVVRITLVGEVLFLSAWERGTWDESADDWSKDLPPLMPVAVLETLSSVSGVVRNEDQKRLSQPASGEDETGGWGY